MRNRLAAALGVLLTTSLGGCNRCPDIEFDLEAADVEAAWIDAFLAGEFPDGYVGSAFEKPKAYASPEEIPCRKLCELAYGPDSYYPERLEAESCSADLSAYEGPSGGGTGDETGGDSAGEVAGTVSCEGVIRVKCTP